MPMKNEFLLTIVKVRTLDDGKADTMTTGKSQTANHD